MKYFKSYDIFNPPQAKVIEHHTIPTKMYHGTNTKFDTFDMSKKGLNFDSSTLGIYFTQHLSPPPYSSTAKEYAEIAIKNHGGEPIVYEVELAIQNPLVLNSYGWYNSNARIDVQRDIITKWISEGDYDAVVVYNFEEDQERHRDYIAVVWDTQLINITNVISL
jgi:hypothetical protein